MTELFTELPVEVKEEIANFINYAINNFSPFDYIRMINEFAKNCSTEEQDFIDFYTNFRLEQMINESDTN